MGNLKAKTLIEQHGFKDSDLTTPEHDKIMFWVVENIEKIINDVIIKDFTKFEIQLLDVEHAIINYRSYNDAIIGFLDLLVKIKTDKTDKIESQKRSIAIEIKSKILSVGETIRQLNFYKSYSKFDYYLIISPDDRFMEFFVK